jgi:hypothetical protein
LFDSDLAGVYLRGEAVVIVQETRAGDAVQAKSEAMSNIELRKSNVEGGNQ